MTDSGPEDAPEDDKSQDTSSPAQPALGLFLEDLPPTLADDWAAQALKQIFTTPGPEPIPAAAGSAPLGPIAIIALSLLDKTAPATAPLSQYLNPTAMNRDTRKPFTDP